MGNWNRQKEQGRSRESVESSYKIIGLAVTFVIVTLIGVYVISIIS